jgi:hypothetical protein
MLLSPKPIVAGGEGGAGCGLPGVLLSSAKALSRPSTEDTTGERSELISFPLLSPVKRSCSIDPRIASCFPLDVDILANDFLEQEETETTEDTTGE